MSYKARRRWPQPFLRSSLFASLVSCSTRALRVIRPLSGYPVTCRKQTRRSFGTAARSYFRYLPLPPPLSKQPVSVRVKPSAIIEFLNHFMGSFLLFCKGDGIFVRGLGISTEG